MNFDLILGAIALAYGLYSLVLRVSGRTSQWSKLEPMKVRFGETAGNVIHVVAYTIVPIVFGCILLFKAWGAGIDL